MNQYHIRIDGEQSTNSYTYQELVDMGLFELDADGLDGIEVKNTTKSYFTPFKSFCFPEHQSNESSYYVDEYGQIHRKNQSQNNGYVDEFGQIVRSTGYTHSSSDTSSSIHTSSSSSSSSSSNSTSNSDISGRIIGTILVLVIGIPILINVGFEGFWGSVIFVVGSMIIWGIWDKYL